MDKKERGHFPEAHRWTGEGVGHLDLLNRPEVYETLRGWLSGAEADRTTSAGA